MDEQTRPVPADPNKFTLSKAEARLLAGADLMRRQRAEQIVRDFNDAVGDILESHGVARDKRGSFYATPDGVIVWNADGPTEVSPSPAPVRKRMRKPTPEKEQPES